MNSRLLKSMLLVKLLSGGHLAIQSAMLQENDDTILIETTLVEAIENGHYQAVEHLLAAGAHVDLRGKYGATPLMRAIGKGHLATVEQLLAARANVYAADLDEETVLIWAAYYDHTEIIKTLINACCIQLIKPYHVAIQAVVAVENSIRAKQTAHLDRDTGYRLNGSTSCDLASRFDHSLDRDLDYGVQTVFEIPPSTLETLPSTWLQNMVTYLPLLSLGHLRQASKTCRVATEFEYAAQLRKKIFLNQQQFNASINQALYYAQEKTCCNATPLLRQATSINLWQHCNSK